MHRSPRIAITKPPRWIVLWLFCLTAFGCDTPTDNGTIADAASPTALGPIQVMWTVHIEGWSDEAEDAEAFERHVARIESMRTIIEEHGIVANWEIRTDQFLAGVINHRSDILQTWLNAGHGVEIHADIGGAHNNDMRLQNELGRRMQEMREYGLEPTSASGICSEADWVSAAANNSLQLVDGIVEYCLKSLPVENLPAEYTSIADCTDPADCHDGVFSNELLRSVTPWRPLSADDWTMPGGATSMPILILDGPWNGTLACMAEPDDVQGRDCILNADDADAFDAQLNAILEARRPGIFYGFIIGAASIGSEVNADGLETVTSYLQTEVDLGHIQFVTAAQIVERYVDWEASGIVPGTTP